MWILAVLGVLIVVLYGTAVLLGIARAVGEQDDRTYGTRRY